MHVAEFGPTDGPPIVFLHGSMVAGWMWMGQVAHLSSDHRIIVPDLPGFDRSAEHEWVSAAATAENVAELIADRCIGGSAHVVGLSLGGIVGLWLARDHPARVRSLLVSGVPFGSIPRSVQAVSRVLLWLYQRSWGARLVAKAFGMPDDESMEAFVGSAQRTDPRALESIMAEVNEAPLPDGLERITTSVLSVVGEKDTEPARRAVRHLVTVVSRAEGRQVQGVGHQWNAEAPELFSEMVRAWVDAGSIDDRLKHLDVLPN
jgi:pimeloyl-ACP methyl ester carboxylesterase